jgi:hypothetical protein
MSTVQMFFTLFMHAHKHVPLDFPPINDVFKKGLITRFGYSISIKNLEVFCLNIRQI